MATGTGKTTVAFQICWKLWSARWTAPANIAAREFCTSPIATSSSTNEGRDFSVFGDARHKIEVARSSSREMYFAIYQALAEDERRQGLFRLYPSDFFDLAIIDECHRGSGVMKAPGSILEYSNGYQLGMTATPLRADNRDTLRYFGNRL